MHQVVRQLAAILESQIGGEGAVAGLSEGPVEVHAICDDICSWDWTGWAGCKDTCQAVVDAINSTWDWLTEAYNDLVAMYDELVAMYDSVMDTLTGFLDVAVGAVGWLVEQVIALPLTIQNALGDLWGQIMAGLTFAIDTVVALIPAGLEDLWGLIPAAGSRSRRWSSGSTTRRRFRISARARTF